ncbi:MAG: hypothetical protein E7667_05360 [Ruminococcaceae bacterium]|nr:hypothetical protein [Oscillospiraceae bacterium]
MKKVTKIILAVLAAVLALVLLAVSGFSIYDRVKYREFYKNAEKAFEIPGLWSGAVQQGFDYSEDMGLYIYSGYMKDGSASRIYIFDGNGSSRYAELREKDGSDCTEHVGGVSFGGEYIYVTASSDNSIMMFKTSDVLDGDGVATACDEFEVCLSSAYVYVRGNTLYTGEFYIEKDYETPKDHHITTPKGDKNTALMAVYALGKNGKPASSTPDYVMSTRGQVQGMAFDSQGRLILSTSWGLNPSNLYVYDLDRSKWSDPDEKILTINDENIRVRYIDSSCLDATITAPPMAEELVYKDGKLLIMNESASMKYLFGKITSGNHVWAYRYDDTADAPKEGDTEKKEPTLKPANPGQNPLK